MDSPSLPADQEEFLARALADERLFESAWPYDPLQAMLRIARTNDLFASATASAVPGFVMATTKSSKSRAMVAMFEQSTGELAGAAEGKNIIVRLPFQRMGIGSELMIKAFEIGLFHPRDMNAMNFLSTGGRQLRKSAHRLAVQRAISVGIEVRPEVVAPYAEIATETAPERSATDTVRTMGTPYGAV